MNSKYIPILVIAALIDLGVILNIVWLWLAVNKLAAYVALP